MKQNNMVANKKHLMYRFWKLHRSEHKYFYLLMFCSLLGNILVVAMTFLMALGIDKIVAIIQLKEPLSVTLGLLTEQLLPTVLLLVLFSLISSGLSYVQERAMATLSERLTLNTRKLITKKIKKLPMSFFDNHQVGDLISRTTTGLNQLSQVLLTGVNQLFTSIVTILFAGIMLIYIDSKMSILVIGLLVLSGLVTHKFSMINKEVADKAQVKLGSINNEMEEYLSGVIVSKSFNQENQQMDAISQTIEEHYTVFKRAQFLNFAIYPLSRFINQSAFIFSAIFGAMTVLSGGITIGFLQAYLQYINQISEPISTASYVINSIQAAMASIERIFYILDHEEEQADTSRKTIQQPAGNIRFKDVRFGYSPDKTLMKKVDFDAKANQKIAIVGPTGAGKTTLVNLLMRFYDIESGQIEFDGIPTTDLPRENLRSLFGMVLQNTWLFEGTIAENIAYGKMDATREEIIQAAKIAQCHHFILTLPNGYDSLVTSDNGGGLSQGQQQLLTIARVILANPPVVILDEATSSVDTRTELQIQEAMNSLTQNRTSFVIAHRLSTIENADLILVMDKGDIIEKGTHKQLLKRPTLYRSLYNSQFQAT